MDEAEIRKLTLRSWRRGMREMDLLLGPFAEAELPGMSEAERTAYAALLEESDPDLLAWIVAETVGRPQAPAAHAALIARIARAAEGRMQSAKF